MRVSDATKIVAYFYAPENYFPGRIKTNEVIIAERVLSDEKKSRQPRLKQRWSSDKQRAYYAANRERILAQQRERDKSEARKQHKRAYYAANRKRLIERSKSRHHNFNNQ